MAEQVLAFIVERLRVQLREEGARHDVLAAVFAAGGDDDLVLLLARTSAVAAVLGTETGANLFTAYRRAANILRIEEKKDGPFDAPPEPGLLREAEEKTLAEALETARRGAEHMLKDERFEKALEILSPLRDPLDAFFERVTVNAKEPELRRNRLQLLQAMRSTIDRIADFSKIEARDEQKRSGFEHDEMGLRLWRRPRGGAGGDAQPARRQGRELGRDGLDRAAGAARLHHHDRGVQRLLSQRSPVSRRFAGRGRRPPSTGWKRRPGGASAIAPSRCLVSVRSGARASMPGMMDTVLNLGLNDATVEGLGAGANDPRFAWDSYRRFIQMYGNVVLGVDHHRFEEIIEHAREDAGLSADPELSAQDWHRVVAAYKDLVEAETGRAFPQDPEEQLWGAIGAVFGSWMNPRAITYRRLHEIPAEWGTAVNVQAMVFGNMGENCATGVCFTRDPSTGENVFFGEYLVNAQGEDVVAGIRTPAPLSKARAKPGELSMEEALPEAYRELSTVRETLERHYRDMQDIEFTVERGRLYLLQTRNGKRTAAASLRIAVEMAGEGLIDESEAVGRVDPANLDQLLHPTLDPNAPRKLFSRGLPASPGAASGAVVFSADEAEMRAANGEAVVLVRIETSPEDIHGMHAAQGRPDHARRHDEPRRGGGAGHGTAVRRRRRGDHGRLRRAGSFGGRNERARGRDDHHRRRDRRSVRGRRRDGRARALGRLRDPDGMGRPLPQARRAGQCRHAAGRRDGAALRRRRDRALPHRAHVLRAGRDRRGAADDHGGRRDRPARRARASLLPFQRQDFVALFRIMAGLPVTIRLLDPPLHEFLPHSEEELAEVALALGADVDAMRRRAAELAEANPMLGHRGCRLGISYPEIYAMQARAIFEAAVAVGRETGNAPLPEIMIPLVATKRELEVTRSQVERVAKQVFFEAGQEIPYTIGTMIELPRAALTADQIAEAADFFSFGTNDLTQTTFGLSRDDAGKFLPRYIEIGVLAKDPFVSIDTEGVGALMRIATEKGRGRKPGLKLGICGEHGGDPASIAFCETIGLDYVSCSPYRVPVARLAAAQAALASGREKAARAATA